MMTLVAAWGLSLKRARPLAEISPPLDGAPGHGLAESVRADLVSAGRPGAELISPPDAPNQAVGSRVSSRSWGPLQ